MDRTGRSDAAVFSKAAYIGIGVCLIAQFFCPIINKGKVGFPGIDALSSGDVVVIIDVLSPLIAGIAVLVAASWPSTVGRAQFLLAVGALTLFFNWTPPAVQLGGPLSSGLLVLIGLVGVSAGSRARIERPSSRAAAAVGVMGGVAFLLALLVPTVTPYSMFRDLNGSMYLLLPFRIMFTPDFLRQAVGFVLLAAIGLTAAGAIICLMNRSVDQGDAEARARLAWRLCVIGLLAYVVLWVLVRLAGDSVLSLPQDSLFEWSLITRYALWFVGLGLLILFSTTQWIISASPSAVPAVRPSISLP